MVLLAAFDCVDDTKLVSKAIVGEIIGDGKDEDSNKIAEIFGSEKAGRKVLLYLLGMFPKKKSRQNWTRWGKFGDSSICL